MPLQGRPSHPDCPITWLPIRSTPNSDSPAWAVLVGIRLNRSRMTLSRFSAARHDSIHSISREKVDLPQPDFVHRRHHAAFQIEQPFLLPMALAK